MDLGDGTIVPGILEPYDPSTTAVVTGGTLNRIAVRMMHCSILDERNQILQHPEMREVLEYTDNRMSKIMRRLETLLQELHNLTGSTSPSLGMAATGLAAGSPQDHRS